MAIGKGPSSTNQVELLAGFPGQGDGLPEIFAPAQPLSPPGSAHCPAGLLRFSCSHSSLLSLSS